LLFQGSYWALHVNTYTRSDVRQSVRRSSMSVEFQGMRSAPTTQREIFIGERTCEKCKGRAMEDYENSQNMRLQIIALKVVGRHTKTYEDILKVYEKITWP